MVSNVNKQYNLSNDYKPFKEKKRKASENEKLKCRERNSTDTQKAKCKKRKATCIEKEKTKKKVVKQNKKIAKSDSNQMAVFKTAIKEGPCYICVVCCLYKRTVKLFNESKYELVINVFTPVLSFDAMHYISYTCDRHLLLKLSLIHI